MTRPYQHQRRGVEGDGAAHSVRPAPTSVNAAMPASVPRSYNSKTLGNRPRTAPSSRHSFSSSPFVPPVSSLSVRSVVNTLPLVPSLRVSVSLRLCGEPSPRPPLRPGAYSGQASNLHNELSQSCDTKRLTVGNRDAIVLSSSSMDVEGWRSAQPRPKLNRPAISLQRR